MLFPRAQPIKPVKGSRTPKPRCRFDRTPFPRHSKESQKSIEDLPRFRAYSSFQYTHCQTDSGLSFRLPCSTLFNPLVSKAYTSPTTIASSRHPLVVARLYSSKSQSAACFVAGQTVPSRSSIWPRQSLCVPRGLVIGKPSSGP